MSIRKNLTLLSLSTLMLVFSACSNEKNKSSHAQLNEVRSTCEGLECLSSVNWKISLQGHMFPSKSRVEINGNTVLDECLSKQESRIDREAAPQNLVIENYLVPKQGEVKIEIFDQGWDCSQNLSFISKENVEFVFVKGSLANEIEINL
jgi:hypothetical protein